MAHKLRKLKIDRVDLVDKGANQAAHVLLFKRDMVGKARTFQEVMDERHELEEAREAKWKYMDAFMCVLKEAMDIDDESEQMRVLVTSASQFVQAMRPVDDVLSQLEEDVYMTLEELQKAHDELKQQHDEQVAALEKERDKAIADLEAEIAKSAQDPEEEFWKGMPESVRKRFQEQESRIQAAEAVAKAEHDARVQHLCIQKAESYESLPINPQEDWEVFKAIDQLDEKISSRLYQLLSAGDAGIAKAMPTHERGRAGADGEGLNAYEQVDRLVQEKMQKSEGMTYSEATSLVFKENPPLYAEYTKSVRRAGKGD